MLFQLVVDMLVGSNGAKHTLRIPVHTIYMGRAGNTNWGVGKQDREGKAADKGALSDTMGDQDFNSTRKSSYKTQPPGLSQ